MSPNMKLSVLAFVGAAAAIPQYNVGGHGHGHASAHRTFTPSVGNGRHAYPTGGWANYNSTVPSAPTGQPQGTGKPSLPAEEQSVSESDYTLTSTTTRTVYLTQYPASSEPTAVGVKDVTSEAAPVCGQTVYVTETNRVTVTVSAGAASSAAPQASEAPSSAGYEAAKPSEAAKPTEAAPKPSSAAPVASAPGEGYEVPTSFVLASSAEAEKPTSTPAAVSTSAAYQEAVSSAASSAAPVSSVKESSAAPSATSTPSTGYTGGKRGLAYRWDGAADCKSFEGHKFGFVWNWEADTKGDIGSFAGNFIPTLRTRDNAGDWASKAQAAIDAGSKVLFGFNEPDISSQANMDVPTLCAAWKDNMNDFHGKATIVGPSVSSSQNEGQGLSYLQKFVNECPEAKFDDINIHWYGPASAGFDAFQAHFEDAKTKFPGKKIWVSEFGLEPGSAPEDSAAFLKKAQSYLDGESSCAGYSYFAVGTFDAAANLLGTASALSPAGKVYTS